MEIKATGNAWEATEKINTRQMWQRSGVQARASSLQETGWQAPCQREQLSWREVLEGQWKQNPEGNGFFIFPCVIECCTSPNPWPKLIPACDGFSDRRLLRWVRRVPAPRPGCSFLPTPLACSIQPYLIRCRTVGAPFICYVLWISFWKILQFSFHLILMLTT